MKPDEKERLRGFVLTILDFVNLSPSDRFTEPIRNCDEPRGLRAAASDMVEMCQDLSVEEVEQLDTLLMDKGLPSLTEMRDRDLQRLRAILSRNRIKNASEWRFVESYLSDVDSVVLTTEDRKAANRMLADYDSN